MTSLCESGKDVISKRDRLKRALQEFCIGVGVRAAKRMLRDKILKRVKSFVKVAFFSCMNVLTQTYRHAHMHRNTLTGEGE